MTERLYSEFAQWWTLLSPPYEYEEEAAFYRRALEEHATNDLETLLELGSGGGNNASFLKQRFEMTLVDLSPSMLEVSANLNPECRHEQGDMRTVRLDGTFDAVFIHDAIDYITTPEDLRKVFRTVNVHLVPGGVALFAPDFVREQFHEMTDHGGTDGPERGLRYLEWTWDPDPADHTYITDFAYLLRVGEDVRVEHDRHICGLFSTDEWLTAMADEGLQGQALPRETDEELGLTVFVARSG